MAALKKLPWNGLLTILFVAANVLAWSQVLAVQPHIVEPIMDPEVEALLSYIRSGDHSGETWEVTLTELEAEQTITWYLQKYPQIPFAYPDVEITPDYIAGEGDVTVPGLPVRVHVGAKVNVTLKNGLPVVKILSLSLPFPQPVQDAIEQGIQNGLQRAAELPVRFTSAEWGDGVVVVKGTIR